MIRFYAPVRAVTVDVHQGTRQLTLGKWGYSPEGEPELYPAGTVYVYEAGGVDDDGQSYVDVRVIT